MLKRLTVGVGLAALLAASLPRPAIAEAARCQWLAGDLHIHTTHSHDSWAPHEIDDFEPWTLGWPVHGQFTVAQSRDLDYLAITDHDDITSQSDVAFKEARERFGVLPIPGYEASYSGHAQMLGATTLYRKNNDAAVVESNANALRAAGGLFQINHPAEGSTQWPHDPDWGYGYQIVPDTVEVWNINRVWQPPLPSASSNDDAVRYWEGWLERGYEVGATGGSDNHYVSTSSAQGAGQPTTWVCASSRSVQDVLDGLKAGRTFIAHQPPSYQGPQLHLEADNEHDREFESIVGDAVRPGARFRVRVLNAPSANLKLFFGDGDPATAPTSSEAIDVEGTSFTHEFEAPAGATWARAEVYENDGKDERKALCDGLFGSETTYCRNQLLVFAMTSALYIAPESFDPATTLVYDGDRSGKVGDIATFSATLTGSNGPISGAAITFVYRGKTYSAVTDDGGRASTEVRLTGPPGTDELSSRFSGSDVYDPSSDSDEITVTTGP